MKPIQAYRTYALGAFRWSVFFIFAVVAFSERDAHTRTILVTIVFLLDVISWHLCLVMDLTGAAVYNQVWFDTLTNRFTLEKLADKVKYKQSIEVPALIKEGLDAARQDLERFVRDGTYWHEWGGFKKTMHGVGYFVWWWISYGLFYGAAAFLSGNAGHY